MDNKVKEDNIEESKEAIKNKKHDQGYNDEAIETQEVDMMISNMGRVINEGLEAKLAEGIMKGERRGIIKGEQIGIMKGEKIGSEKKSIITAIEMLKDNMNIELVAKYSKLNISKVKDIKNNLEEYKQVYLDK